MANSPTFASCDAPKRLFICLVWGGVGWEARGVSQCPSPTYYGRRLNKHSEKERKRKNAYIHSLPSGLSFSPNFLSLKEGILQIQLPGGVGWGVEKQYFQLQFPRRRICNQRYSLNCRSFCMCM